MVAGNAREVIEELTVLGVEVLSIPGLHQAGYVLGKVAPPSRSSGLVLYVVFPCVVVFVDVRHRQVAREDVVQGRDVRRALDGRVATQGHHPTARTSYVS